MFAMTRERAQGLVEYGLIIALVAVLAIAGLVIFGPAVSSLLSKLGGSVYAFNASKHTKGVGSSAIEDRRLFLHPAID